MEIYKVYNVICCRLNLVGKYIVDLKSYNLEDQIGYLLRKAYQRHLVIFQQHIGDSQLTAVQFSVLYTVNLFEKCSQKELVEHTAIDQATIRGIVERLIKRDLLSQYQDQQDKRKVKISITNEGRKVLADTLENAKSISEKTLEPLNPAEALALLHTLKKIT